MLADSAAQSAARIARIPAHVKHIHLMGVAGSAMAALAGMLAARGFRVTGSDNQLYEPAASHARSDCNIKCAKILYGCTTSRPAPDLVVVGNVITRANPEAQALLAIADSRTSRCPKRCGISSCANARADGGGDARQNDFDRDDGACARRPPAAIPRCWSAASRADFATRITGSATGRDFVIEGDEYDTAFFDKGPKFLHYRAQRYDHHRGRIRPRGYLSRSRPRQVFVPRAGRADGFSARAGGLRRFSSRARCHAEDARAQRLTFGLIAGEFRATDIRIGADWRAFLDRARRVSASRSRSHLPIGGRMNVANALGVWVLLKEFGLAR